MIIRPSFRSLCDASRATLAKSLFYKVRAVSLASTIKVVKIIPSLARFRYRRFCGTILNASDSMCRVFSVWQMGRKQPEGSPSGDSLASFPRSPWTKG